MPPADLITQLQRRVNLILYGRERLRKTTWAMAAAEHNFNVIHIGGDRGGSQVVNQLSPKARKHIQLIDAEAEPNKPVIAQFLAALLKRNIFTPWWWDEKQKLPIIGPNLLVAENPVYEINLAKLTLNDIIVIDSWSTVAWCLHWQYALENGIDFAEFSKMEDKWSDYGYTGHVASLFLAQLAGLNCHRIVVCHENIYEKRDSANRDRNRRNDILYTRTQIKSTSGNHAGEMAKDFDLLYFKLEGNTVRISTGAEQERMGGCRTIPAGTFAWQDLQFNTFCQRSGISIPSSPVPCEAFKYYGRSDQCPAWGQRVTLKKAQTLVVPKLVSPLKLNISGMKS